MKHLNHVVHPSKCYCQIAPALIRKWVIERYIEHRNTIDLLASVTDVEDREAISAVALIDVEEGVLLQMMSELEFSDHHILDCREKAKQLVLELTREQ